MPANTARPTLSPSNSSKSAPISSLARANRVGFTSSASMLAEDVKPTRLARAKLLIGALLDELEGERVGLAVFAGTAFLQVPMSSDYEIMRDILPGLDPSYLPQSGTDYTGMLRVAMRLSGKARPQTGFSSCSAMGRPTTLNGEGGWRN